LSINAESEWRKAIGSGELHNETLHDLTIDEAINDVTFTDCGFEQVTFQCEEMSECIFIDCQFRRCNFSSLKFQDCSFKNCQFYDGKTETGCVFKFATVTASQFEHCDLSMANFSRANLYRSGLLHCQAQGADLSQISVESKIGGKISLFELSLSHCNFAYSDFSGAQLQESSITDCRLIHSIFNDANLEGATLTDNELHGMNADRLVLRGADLRGSGLDGLDVREIDMTGVTIDEGQQRVLLEALGIHIV
jgi:fluoroquinolone resistance protein